MMQPFNYTETELESGTHKLNLHIPVRHGFTPDLQIDVSKVTKPEVLRPVVRLHATEAGIASEPLITVVPNPRGVLIQVEGLRTMLNILTGGNALAVECSSPQRTEIVMPSLPQAFYRVVPDRIVYELLLPVGDKHSIQSLPLTGMNTDVTFDHVGALVQRSICAPIFLPVVQALNSMLTVRELARTVLPEMMERYDTLMPSGAVVEVVETKEVKTSLPYIDFATACGDWQTHMLMLKHSVRVGVGKRNLKGRRLILEYTTIDCLSYIIPEVPSHVIPHLQINKFAKAAHLWKIYPTCYRAGIAGSTEKYNLSEYEL